MCISDNPHDMTRPNELGEMLGMKSSFREKSRLEFLLMDCCSFVGVALGVYDDIPPCATVALIDSDDSDGSISDDSEFLDGVSLFSRDVLKNETTKNANDTTTAITVNTISTLTMEKIPLAKRILQSKAIENDLPSNLEQNNVHVFEDAESLSTLQIPPSLDTKTMEMPSPLKPETPRKTLQGLKLVESKVKDTKQKDIEREEVPNRPKSSRHRNPYDIERVPSMVDTSGKDDESVVSAMSAVDVGAKESITKRLFGGKRKILRPWSRKNNINKKIEAKESVGGKSPSIWRASFDQKAPVEPARPLIIVAKPTELSALTNASPVLRSIPSPVRRHAPRYASPSSPPRLLEKPTTEDFRSIVPAIKTTKSNDITASTVGTEEEERTDNIPFDEEPSCKSNSPSRLQTTQNLRVNRYLRPSSKLDFKEF